MRRFRWFLTYRFVLDKERIVIKQIGEMELEKLTEQLFGLYQNTKYKQVFATLKRELNIKTKKMITFSLLQNRFNGNSDEQMAGTISRKKANRIRNEIGVDLLSFIQSLDPTDIGSEIAYPHVEITNPILIFTKKKEVENVNEFFLQLNFINVEVKPLTSEDYLLDDFDLIIFDNQDLPVCRNESQLDNFDAKVQKLITDRIEQMESILQQSSKFLIHFGDILFWINKNRNRVQAANSKFSLHARTKEVIDFINTYRV